MYTVFVSWFNMIKMKAPPSCVIGIKICKRLIVKTYLDQDYYKDDVSHLTDLHLETLYSIPGHLCMDSFSFSISNSLRKFGCRPKSIII